MAKNTVFAEIPEAIQNKTKNFENADEETYRLKNQLIAKHSAHISHLAGIPIKILFSLKEKKSRGRSVLGTAKSFSEMDRLLHGWTFLITLDAKFWKENPDKREPLLFHELMHCDIDEDDKVSMRDHDIQEFDAVVRAYGNWSRDVESFTRAVQLNLLDAMNETEDAPVPENS